MANHINKFMVWLGLACLVSCSTSHPPRYVTAALPAPSGDGTCRTQASEAKPFTMCDWYHMADAYFVGEIVSFEPVVSPAYDYTLGVQETCGGPGVTPGGVFRFRPIRWLTGAPADPSSDFTVHIGGSKLSTWGVFRTDETGTARFTSGDANDEPLFAVGSVVGGALMRAEAPLLGAEYVGGDGRVWWVPENVFTVDAEGFVLDPQAKKAECGSRRPGIEGMSLDALSDALSACVGSDTSLEAKNLYEIRSSGSRPQSRYAAVCHKSDVAPTSRACDESTLCRIGFCEKSYCECHGAEICESYWKKLGL